jgi:hypothetical protein
MIPHPIDQAKTSPVAMPNETSETLFFEAIRSTNPFERNCVSDPSQLVSDVLSIHEQAFERLLAGSDKAFTKRTATALMVLGEAGVGKSHLLARLAKQARKAGDCFCYLHNLRVRPEDLDRYILKCCISQLADDRRAEFAKTQLFRIVDRAICQAALAERITAVKNKDFLTVCKRLMNRLGVDEEVFEIIFRFYYSARKLNESKSNRNHSMHQQIVALAIRWLKGDFLEREEAKLLGARSASTGDQVQMREDQILPALITMAKLALEASSKFIICFDQCDNMKPASLEGLCRFLHTLIDESSASNIFIVFAGVRAEIETLLKNNTITPPQADRLNAATPITLSRLKVTEARRVLEDRLTEFYGRDHGLPAHVAPFSHNDTLFPLGSHWFEEIVANQVEVRPRDILRQASDRWERIQNHLRQLGDAAWLQVWRDLGKSPQRTGEERQRGIDDRILAKVQEAESMRRLDPGQLPADSGNLLALVLELLNHCRQDQDRYSIQHIEAKPYDAIVLTANLRNQPVMNYVKFLVTENKTSTAARLRQTLDQTCERLMLVTDERVKLQRGAMGQKHYDMLTALGSNRFQHFELAFSDYARLDALIAVIGDAQSGDLEVELGPQEVTLITPEQVIACYHRHDLYRQHPLLKEFLTEGETPVRLDPPEPHEARFREFLTQRLSFLMGANLIELTKTYLRLHATEVTLDEALPKAREIALKMHQDGIVCAKPWNNDLYLVVGTAQ